MRPRTLAALSLAILATLPSPARAIAVFGFDIVAVGSANVIDEPVGGGGMRRVIVNNIGSSGQDGVAITLPAGGMSLRIATPPGSPVAAGQLSVYRLPSDATPIIRGSWTSSGSGERVYGITVQTPVMHCSVYDGDLRVLSASVPSSTPVSVSGLVVQGDTTRTVIYRAKAGSSGSTKREISLDFPLEQLGSITLGATTVTGDRIVFDVEQDGPPELASTTRLTLANEVGSPPMQAIITEMAVSPGIVRLDPRGFNEGMELIVVRGAEQVATASVESVEPDFRYTTSGSATADVRLAFRPTAAFHRWGWTYAELPVDEAARAQRIVAHLQVDDGSGLPPVDGTFTVDWMSDGSGGGGGGSGGCLVSAGSSLPTDEVTYQVYALGRPVGQPAAAGLGTHVQCSTQPVRVTALSDPDYMDESLDFVAGTMFLVDGVPQFGDQMKIVAKGSGGRSIRDVRIVHPPGTPPGNWRLGSVVGSPVTRSTEEGGRPAAARGPRQSVSLDGSYAGSGGTPVRRLPVRNLGSSGEDGVEVQLNGVHSVAFDFLDDPTQVPPVAMSLSTRACLDGTCADDPAVEVSSTAVGFTVTGRLIDDTSAARTIQVGGHWLPMSSADLDLDGDLDLVFAAPEAARIASIRYQSVSATTEGLTLEFTAPVQIQCDDGPQVVTKIDIGSVTSGGSAGRPRPQAASLKGLPPGEPVLGRHGVCDFSIRPPGMLLSGIGIGRPDIGELRAGLMTQPTWGRAEGPIGLEGETGGDAVRAITRDPAHLERPSLRATASQPTGCIGMLTEASPPSGLIWSPRSNLAMSSYGDLATGETDVLLHRVSWDLLGDAGQHELRYHAGLAGSPPLVRVYSGGMMVAEQAGDVVLCGAPPAAVFAGGDLDGDGAPEVDLRGLPPGTPVIIGGAGYAGDRVTFQIVGGSAVTAVRSAVLELDGVPSGVPVAELRMSAVVPGLSSVDVTPRRPAGRALEVRGIAPNPARGASTLRLAMGEAARVRIEVLDVAGRIVATLHDGALTAGEHALAWSGRTASGQRVAPGLYLARVSGEGLATQTARIVRVE